MRRKRIYANRTLGAGRRGRGRGARRGFGPQVDEYVDVWEEAPRPRRGGRRRVIGPWQDFEGFGPPPWSPRWGWTEGAPDFDEDASYGPPPWGMGRWMWPEGEEDIESRRAWLEARKARLQAWKKHLDARLAETEAELTALDASDAVADVDEEAE